MPPQPEQLIKQLEAQVSSLGARLTTAEAQIQAFSGLDTFPYETIQVLQRYFPQFLFGKATLDFPSTSAGASATKTIGISGARPGDVVVIGLYPNSVGAGIIYDAYVSAQDVVTVEFQNQTGGVQDLDSALVFNVLVIQKP